MKPVSLFLLFAVVAVAAGLATAGPSPFLAPALTSLALRSAVNVDANVPDEVKAEFEKLAMQAAPCLKGKGFNINSTIAEILTGAIECLNNKKDNSACCAKAGMGDACAKQFCNGTPPVKWTITLADLAQCAKDGHDNAKEGVELIKCYAGSQ